MIKHFVRIDPFLAPGVCNFNLQVNLPFACFSFAVNFFSFDLSCEKFYYDGDFVVFDTGIIGFVWTNNAHAIFTDAEIKQHLRETGYLKEGE